MPTFFACFKFSLFSRREEARYHPEKSLADNFFSLCKLPCYKANSHASNELITILKTCTLHSTRKTILTRTERLQDIATLELAILAMTYWLKCRTGRSSRTESVSNLLTILHETQASMIQQDHHETMHAWRSLPSKDRHWHHPKANIDILCKHLPNESMQHSFSDLITKLNSPLPANERTALLSNKLRCAIFTPILNSLLEFDCFDLLFDGFDAYLNLAGLF